MKSEKLIFTILGSWLLFIAIDGTQGRIGRRGVSKLSLPLEKIYALTGTVKGIVMFSMAVATLLLMMKRNGKKNNYE